MCSTAVQSEHRSISSINGVCNHERHQSHSTVCACDSRGRCHRNLSYRFPIRVAGWVARHAGLRGPTGLNISLRQCRFSEPAFVLKIRNVNLASRTMSYSTESILNGSRLVSTCNRHTGSGVAWRRPSGYLAAIVAKIRDLAPYAAIELVLPGGSLIALLLWAYRRRQKADGPGSPGWLGYLLPALRP